MPLKFTTNTNARETQGYIMREYFLVSEAKKNMDQLRQIKSEGQIEVLRRE